MAKDYSKRLAELGLDTADAIKAWQSEYGLEQTGTWSETEEKAYKAYKDSPYKTEAALKEWQLANGIKDTGKWDSTSKTTYRKQMAAEGAIKNVDDLAARILKQYNLPTTDQDAIRASVEAYMRGSYDKAIAQQAEQAAEARAMVDLDAYSRGMGASTWDTDAKMRIADAEAENIAAIESDYMANLSKAVIDQYNTNKAQELAAQNNAYALATQLYGLGESAKNSVKSYSSGGGYSYGGSSSGGSSSRSGSSATPQQTSTNYNFSTTATSKKGAMADLANAYNQGKVNKDQASKIYEQIMKNTKLTNSQTSR